LRASLPPSATPRRRSIRRLPGHGAAAQFQVAHVSDQGIWGGTRVVAPSARGTAGEVDVRASNAARRLAFELDSEQRQLTAYTFEGGDGESLFVPFLDGTSGTETYGAGRYLDLEPEDDATYTLDFNLAYHPSCVYDVRFSCPLTPAEDRLPIRIEAGERLHPAAD